MPTDTAYLPVVTALAVYRVICRRPRTIPEIAAEIGVRPLTVRRMIQALAASGVAIAKTRRPPAGLGQPPIAYRAARI